MTNIRIINDPSGFFPHIKQDLQHMDIELTERCNNQCIHCYINQPEHDLHTQSREMDTAFVQDLLVQAADLGCMSVRFTGGEPLLREDFLELYLFSRRLGMRVTLFTNARLITSELAALLKRIPPGRPVAVSVYGMHAHSYNAVASSHGAFDEFWQGIQLLNEYDIPFIVKQSLLPQNKHELAEFEAFASHLPSMKNNPSYATNFDLRARRDNPQKNYYINSLRMTPKETVEHITRDKEGYLNDMREYTRKFMRPPGDQLFTCGAGSDICVDAFGKAQMCLLLRHPDIVYPLQGSLQIENNPHTTMKALEYALKEFFPAVRQMRSTNPDYLKRCAVCFIHSLCEQCPAKSWEEHGTLDTPIEYFCQLAHAQARYLGLVLEGEQAWKLPEKSWRERLAAFLKIQ